MNKIEELEISIQNSEELVKHYKDKINAHQNEIANAQKDLSHTETEIAEKQKQLDELKKQNKKRWRAEEDYEYHELSYGYYYYINDIGKIVRTYDDYTEEDDYRYNSGNYAQTKEELERKQFEILFLQKLEDFAREN